MTLNIRCGGSNGPQSNDAPIDGIKLRTRSGGSATAGKKGKKGPEPPPGQMIKSHSGGRIGDVDTIGDFTLQTGSPVSRKTGGRKKILTQ